MNQLKLKRADGSILTLNVAENWNELRQQELLYVARNWEGITLLLRKGESIVKAKVYLLMNLLRGSAKIRLEAIKLLGDLPDELQHSTLQLVDFLFETKLNFTAATVPMLANGTKRIYGPSAGCNDLTFGEFIFAENYFKNYVQTQADVALYKLVATLYRPFQKSGRRILLSDAGFDFDKNIAFVKTLKYAELQAVLLFYFGCRETSFVNTYKLVFSGGGETLPPEANFGLMNVAFALSDLGGLGTVKELQEENVHLVLQRWQLLLYQQRENEKK